MGLTDFLSSVLTCAQVISAVFLFASSLPRREPLAWRAAVFAGLFLVWSAGTAVSVPLSMTSTEPVLLALTFVVAMMVSLALTVFVFDTSVWAAFFCATAGYTMQNLASGLGSSLIHLLPWLNKLLGSGLIMMVLPFVVVYAICYAVLIRRISKGGLELMRPQAMLAMMVAVIFAVIVYDVVVKQVYEWVEMTLYALISLRLSHALLCVFILVLEYELLYNRRLQREVSAISQIMEDEKEQYRLSKETIEAINLKCHDIRHQIRRLGSGIAEVSPRVIDEIVDEVNVYDAAVRTGNEPLDVILTEKSLVCSREGITLSCIADGSCLDFMAPGDLYSLMGNALDNAIEAARKIEDRERRSISLMVRRSGSTVLIHVENSFRGENLEFRDGLPCTTKADAGSHGYGMKSMRLIAQRYHGTLHARTQGNVFHLNVIVPTPA